MTFDLSKLVNDMVSKFNLKEQVLDKDENAYFIKTYGQLNDWVSTYHQIRSQNDDSLIGLKEVAPSLGFFKNLKIKYDVSVYDSAMDRLKFALKNLHYRTEVQAGYFIASELIGKDIADKLTDNHLITYLKHNIEQNKSRFLFYNSRNNVNQKIKETDILN